MTQTTGIDWRVLRAIALVLLAVRLGIILFTPPFMDETYYWLWGAHPDLSYFDHPPMVAWVNMVAGLFGWNALVLRVPVVATLLIDLALIQAIVMLDEGEDWRERFWVAAALFLTLPVVVLVNSIAVPDHLLIMFALLAFYAVRRFEVARAAGEAGVRWLYLAGFAIGAATLCKYTGAFLGAGLGLFILIRHRDVLANPHLWLAGALAVAMQAPVLLWNMQHDYASFGFITGGRRGFGTGFRMGGFYGYVAGMLAVLSPIFAYGLVRFALRPGERLYPALVIWMSTLAFLWSSFSTNILIHWNLLAYIAVLPYVGRFFGRRWLLWPQLVYGALGLGLLVVNYNIVPLMAVAGKSDQTSSWTYGWPEIAAQVRDYAATERADFIAASDYVLASPLGFALGDRDVTSLALRNDQFDYWFDAKSHAGQSAIIIGDKWRPVTDDIKALFGTVTELGSYRVVVAGRQLNVVRIFIGRDYRPPSQPR